MGKHLAIVLLMAIAAFPQTGPAKPAAPEHKSAPARVPGAQNGAAVPKTPEGIVEFLLPDNVAYVERLGQVPPAQAAAALKQAQPQATGARADAIAFLLVILNNEPDANRTRLLDSLRSCTRDPEHCDESAVPYLGNLFERGDRLVLDPMLDAATGADGSVAQTLGTTYGDMVAGDPAAFITGVSRRPAEDQRHLCNMVATGDGGGLPDDTAADIQSALEKLSGEIGPASFTAKICLNEIKAAAK